MSADERPQPPAGVRGWMEETTTAVRRVGPGALVVRAALLAAGLLAQLVAWPVSVSLGRAGLVLVVFALLPVIAPRSRLVTIVIILSVLGWLVTTSAYGEPVGYWRPVVLAGLLYLVHNLAALAAVLPYDAVVSTGVLVEWVRRVAVVVLLTAAVSLLTLLVPQYAGGHRYLAASLVGLALMVLLAGYLAALIRRR